MTHEHRAGSFFVLRTPLLPFETLLEWSAAGPREEALLAHLRSIAQRPVVREALLLASEDLAAALAQPDPPRRVLLALSRYVCRMASRPTPFGLFAGCSVGTMNDGATALELPPLERYARSATAGLELLMKIADALDDATRARAPLVPTSSRYEIAGQLRYVEERGIDHPLRATRMRRELRTALDLAARGLTADELASELASALNAPLDGARGYVAQLVANQILVPDVRPSPTASDPPGELAARLHAIGAPQAAAIDLVCAELTRIERQPAGAADYAPLLRHLEAVAPETRLQNAMHVVLNKPSESLSLDRGVAGELLAAADLMRRMFARPELDPLHRFREQFLSRYEIRFAPLLEVLDDELGIGLPGFGEAGIDDLPLLQDVPLRSTPEMPPLVQAHTILIEKIGHVLGENARELVIEPSDIEKMSLPNALPLPDSFAAIGTLTGDGGFVVYAFVGPSGAQFLGRFCHSDARLARCVAEWLEEEERIAPDALFAEVVALPDGHDANVVVRPPFTAHEIPFLGRSSRPRELQIEASDLLIGVQEGRLRLWSRKHGREVVARVTNAHNFRARGVSAYRFLGALQRQRVAGAVAWDRGPLLDLPYVPRVRFGRIILSRAQWTVHPEELAPLRSGTAPERLEKARALVSRRGFPRFVLFSEGDNDLFVDWENIVTVDAFVALVRERRARLFEVFPPPDELPVRGPEGHFTNEAVIPFLRREPRAPRPWLTVDETPIPQRLFPPGGRWQYWKIYTGYSTADRILVETIGPAMERLKAEGRIGPWFFIRYGDPDFHIRLRVRAEEDLTREIGALFAPLFEARWIARLQLDTYARELERYGGMSQMERVEELFAADSIAVVKMLPHVQLDPQLRWRVAAYGTDRLLEDVGIATDEARLALYSAVCVDYGRELGDERATKDALARKVRTMKPQLDALFDDPAQRPWQAIYDERSRAIAALPLELDRQPPFTDGIAASLIHMHLNRFFRSMPRIQERVLYDLLERRYRSRLARRTSRNV